MKSASNISVHSETYTRYRDELIQLLVKAEELSEQYPDYFNPGGSNGKLTAAEKILRVQQKLKSDQFSITLCGGFGSGKSTTFNALCGGREVSPLRRNGVCPIFHVLGCLSKHLKQPSQLIAFG